MSVVEGDMNNESSLNSSSADFSNPLPPPQPTQPPLKSEENTSNNDKNMTNNINNNDINTKCPCPDGCSCCTALSEAEKKLSHFKRLIVQSRTMLENYQKQISDKDNLLNNLKNENAELIERMKLQSIMEQKKNAAADSQATSSIRSSNPLVARRRINDDDGSIWVLFEFDDEIVEWRRFSNEVGLNDFVRRESGEPISLPSPSLDPDEAQALIAKSDKAVAKITDEFKRYRVKSEIMRKQKDAEAKQASSISISAQRRQIEGGGGGGSSHDGSDSEKRAIQAEAQLDALMEEMADKEDKWQRTISELKREKEKMLSQGSEVSLATQWRERFEQCQKEKNDLLLKLNQQIQSPSSKGDINSNSKGGDGDGGMDNPSNDEDLPRRFAELRSEYKLYRKRAMEAIAEKDMNIAALKGSPMGHSSLSRSGSIPEDPKLQYLKNLMLKYLCTDEFEAKEHMERAITTILLFTDAERNFIAERRADASASWLVNWMGNQPNA